MGTCVDGWVDGWIDQPCRCKINTVSTCIFISYIIVISYHMSLYIYIYTHILVYTSSTAQGGGESFKNRKPIGEIGCCESGMAERSH